MRVHRARNNEYRPLTCSHDESTVLLDYAITSITRTPITRVWLAEN